jgi:hypothetical protein
MWVTEVFRRPMRATVTAVRSLAPKPSSAAKIPAASRRSTITRPPVTTRRTVRPARRSAWLSRLSSAAAANSARPAGALPKAVDYLHTVAG